jgi:hypothetical protein
MPLVRRALVLAATLLAIPLAGPMAHAAEDGLALGKATPKSLGPLEFGPGNVLFAGDPVGSAVMALDVGAPTTGDAAEFAQVEDLDEKIAAMLGVPVRDLAIQDMEVHGPTRTAYLSLHRGRGADARPVLMRVLPGGRIEEVSLDSIRHARLELANPPAADAKLYRREARTLTITDLEFIDGELFVAGLSNEEFASTLRRVKFPFAGEPAVTGLEIYHGAHGQYETFAPIFSFIPYELEGQQHLLASYLCTPLVTFPLDELRKTARLRGKTIAELGYGNLPIDMIPVKSRGEDYLLITNTTRGAMTIKAADLQAAARKPGITTEVGVRHGVDYNSSPLGSVVQAADFDADNLLLLTRSLETGALTLATRPKEWL